LVRFGIRDYRGLLIGLAAVLIIAALAFGTAQVLRSHGPAPSPSQSPSPAPSGPHHVAVYAFAAGAQNVENPAGVVARIKASPFQPDGIDWVIGWRVLEPTAGKYDWALIDSDLAAATAGGYRSFIEIIPGEDDPAWALGECPTVNLTLQNTGKQVTMCVPTSPQFLALWTQLISAFGQRYDGHAGLTMVQATGCGVQGEMQLPNHNAAFWAQYGVTSQTLLAAWERVLDAWRAALPHTPSSLAIEEPLGVGNSDVLGPLLTYVHEHFGAKVWIQQNGLRQGTRTTPGSYGGDLAAASRWTTVGWQMFGAGSANGDLATALAEGLAVHPGFYEVYLNDVVDATVAPALDQLKSGI
jgi:Beta-galactosidase